MIAAFIIALLTGMGVGSGGLFVVYLTIAESVPQLTAQGLNLYFFIFSTAAALIIHSRTRNLPFKRLFAICAIGSLGCAGGAYLAQNADAGLLRTLFAILLIISGGISLFSSLGKKKNFQKSLYK